MFRLTLVALVLSCVVAFVPVTLRAPSLIARHVLLSDDETKSILQHGIDCVESECSVDDVDDLINTLKEQQEVLNQRLVKVMNMVAHLQEVNQKNDRKTDEVRSFVKDLLRVFNHEKPAAFSPPGLEYTKGPFDSYDVLKPKPWKGDSK
ncbi:hypothetical protein MHU86_8218 [Fragilaria crotonensis]|nr:hypothetical protein MHU86_8218 [Fragilaria crotonensis]